MQIFFRALSSTVSKEIVRRRQSRILKLYLVKLHGLRRAAHKAWKRIRNTNEQSAVVRVWRGSRKRFCESVRSMFNTAQLC